MARARTTAKPTLVPEVALGDCVAGVDEAGRGPLAGPVVAAAVILDRALVPDGLDDSKRLSRKRRDVLHDRILRDAMVGVGIAEVEEIDRINILEATMLAMTRAVAALPLSPQACLIDGNRAPALSVPARTLVGGDRLSASVAAASIIAKVTRDRIMTMLADAFPDYGWARNVGYGTAEHLAAIKRLGPTPHHRRSFAPLRQLILPV